MAGRTVKVAAQAVLIAAIMYLALSCIAYRFSHPEMTETQLFLHIPDALRWNR